jgi:hypothetical protein
MSDEERSRYQGRDEAGRLGAKLSPLGTEKIALVNLPVWHAERMIAEGRMLREWFLPRTSDGYLRLQTRTRFMPDDE